MRTSNRLSIWMSRFAIAGVLLLGLAGMYSPTVAVAAPSPTSGATITSDYADYLRGATVNLTGAGWVPHETVYITVDAADSSWQQFGSAAADDNGAFTYQVQLPNWFVDTYNVTARDNSSLTA